MKKKHVTQETFSGFQERLVLCMPQKSYMLSGILGYDHGDATRPVQRRAARRSVQTKAMAWCHWGSLTELRPRFESSRNDQWRFS